MTEILKNQVFSKEQRQKRNYLIHLLYVRKEFDECLLLIEDTLAAVNEVCVCAPAAPPPPSVFARSLLYWSAFPERARSASRHSPRAGAYGRAPAPRARAR